MSDANTRRLRTANSDFPISQNAPEPTISQAGSRSTKIEVGYAFSSPIFIKTKGIRTTNVRVSKAADTRRGDSVHVEVLVSSLSTTIHSRVHAKSLVNEQNECELCVEVDWSVWDIGLTNAEVSITLPMPSDEPSVHPGIRVDIPSGALGVTMMGSTRFKALDLSTGHGPAHLSDVGMDSLRLVAHNGNITLHDIEAAGTVEITGKAAWMDIDDLHAETLIATSTDAIISLKDIQAHSVCATTTNARIGLGNVKADVLEASTCNGEVVAGNVFADVCNVKVEKGDIEGNWSPRKKLYLSTSNAKIASQVHLPAESSVEMVFTSKNGPIQLDLPAAFEGGFSLQTTGINKTFIHTAHDANINPVLHISRPEHKTGMLGNDSKRHSLRVITEEAPITVNFGSL
ncbi:hypothetical protein H4R99_000470 [Coemansia sp. RSA 1722]|nr:hypothetical protein H4R99_000470 [Coemansia sp. RSA 1722]